MRKSVFSKLLNHPPLTLPPHTTCQHIIGRERKYINCLIIPGKLKKNIHNRNINCRSCYRASFNCIVFHKCGFTALKTAYVTALLIPAVIVRRCGPKSSFYVKQEIFETRKLRRYIDVEISLYVIDFYKL